MPSRRRPTARARPTSEQPRRSVLRRWRDNGHDWVLLECQHVEPASDYPMATALRCLTCLPVRTAPPAPSPDPTEPRW